MFVGILQVLSYKGQDFHHAIVLLIDAVEEQHTQAEERANKLKQLLVKAKKDLTDAKKLVGTVLPAKSDSDIMFVYKVIRD